jgi:PAS domain S-box-containing protein
MPKRKTTALITPARTRCQWTEKLARATAADVASMSVEEVRALAHELQVRQIELELRNAELCAAFDNAPFEFWICDTEGRCILQNAAAAKHWGHRVGKRVEHTDAPEKNAAAGWHADSCRAFAGEVVEGEVEYVCDGELRFQHNIVAPFRVDDEIRGILGFNIDITERKRAENALQRLLLLEQLLAEASSRLIDVSPAELDAVINGVLADVGRLMQVDRCFVRRVSDDLAIVDTTHEWCRSDIHSKRDDARNARAATFPWTLDRMRGGESLLIARTSELPPEAAAERQFLADGNTQSVILVPIRHAGKLTGLIGADAVRAERQWSQEDCRFLRTIGEFLANAQARCQAEQALRASEERFRALITASSEALYRMSPDWSEMRQLHSRSFLANTERPSRTWLDDYIPPDDHAQVMAAVRGAMRTKSVFELEHRVLRADRSVGWAFSRAIPVLDANGEIVEWFGAASDVTARKRSEQALRESEQRLALAASGTEIGFFDWNVATGETLCTAQQICLLGLATTRRSRTPSTTLSRSYHYSGWAERVHREDLPRVESEIRRCMSKHAPFESEYRVVWPDGSLRWIASRGVFQYDRQDQPQRMLGIVMDITDRKCAEAELARHRGQLEDLVKERTARLEKVNADLQVEIGERESVEKTLRESEERLSLAQRAGHVGVFDWDLTTQKVIWTAELEVIFGLRPGGFEGTYEGWAKHVVPDDLRRLEPLFGEWMRSDRTTMQWDYRIVRSDKALCWITACGEILRDSTGRPLRMIGTNVDVTERKKAEMDLDRMKGMLSEGQRIAHVGSFEYIAATGETVWSDEEFRIYGLEPGPRSPSYAALMRKNFHPDDADRVNKQFATALQHGSVFEVEHRIVRPDGCVRDVQNVAYPYFDDSGQLVKYIGVTLDVTERSQAEKELAERAEAIQILHDVASVANQSQVPTQAIDFCLHRLATYNGWRFGHALLPAADDSDLLIPTHLHYPGDTERFSGFREATRRMRVRRGESIAGRVFASAQPVWTNDVPSELVQPRAFIAEELGIRTAVAFPVLIGERVVAVLEFFSDCRLQPDERTIDLMTGVGIQLGRVLERAKFEQYLLAIPEEIQEAIALDLHDDIGQEMTGLGLKARTLAEMLAGSETPAAKLAGDLAATVDRTRTKVRGLSRRLLPVELSEGLLPVAVGQLVAAVNTDSRIACTFRCTHPSAVFDSRVATQLYRIAQEAVSNALRHGGARNIRFALEQQDGETVFRVEDDGRGLSSSVVQASGMGLRTMQYRAGLIGGTLEVGPGPSGGTLVLCRLHPKNANLDA